MATRQHVRNTSRESGKKDKRSVVNDSPEERRERKKFNTRITEQPHRKPMSDIAENETGTDSDSDEIEATSTMKKSTVVSMNEISNFAVILRQALQDPETTEVFRGIFKPMLDDQTKKLKKEMRSIKLEVEGVKQRTDDLEEKVSELEVENMSLNETVKHQQKFMESLDYDQRKYNLIITGLSEAEPIVTDEEVVITNDDDKIDHILRKIGHPDIEITSIQRLGNVRNDVDPQRARPRPIKLTLKLSTKRREILLAARNLHGLPTPLSRVYIKKDTHPGISREYKRLRDVEKKERDKPENQGREVKYDHATRSVRVDDMIIDTFRPSFL